MRFDRDEIISRLRELRYRFDDLRARFRDSPEDRRKILIIGVGGAAALVLLVVRVVTWLPRGGKDGAASPSHEAVASVVKGAESVRPELESDARFASIKIFAVPPSEKEPAGKVLVMGAVASEADFTRLKQLVEKAHPGVPVGWQVAVGLK